MNFNTLLEMIKPKVISPVPAEDTMVDGGFQREVPTQAGGFLNPLLKKIGMTDLEFSSQPFNRPPAPRGGFNRVLDLATDAEPPTQDNIMTNELVAQGKLPPERAEIYSNPDPAMRTRRAPNPYGHLPQPPEDIASIIDQVFGDLSPQARAVAYSENGTFDPRRDSLPNDDGSIDRGIFQVNDDTFEDYQRRMPGRLQEMGISSFDDMLDPTKNAAMAKLIHQYQDWGAWYGPKRLGLDL